MNMKVLNEELKRNIRESLVYAIHSSSLQTWQKRLLIAEFYHSLNRKYLLLNYEVDDEIEKAIKQLTALEKI